MVVHISEKNFRYGQWNKSFTLKGTLIKHMIVQTGERKFKCKQFEKAFARKSCLMQHMAVHTGENNFKYGECNKDFMMRDNLLKLTVAKKIQVQAVKQMFHSHMVFVKAYGSSHWPKASQIRQGNKRNFAKHLCICDGKKNVCHRQAM